MKVYLAGPFFDNKELSDNSKIENILLEKGLDVFVPRKHLVENGENLEHHLWANAVYTMDVNAISECDVMLLTYYGLYSDSGTAFECGYAKSLGIPIIVLYMNNYISSLMITNAAHANLIGMDDLKKYDFNKMNKNKYEKEQK